MADSSESKYMEKSIVRVLTQGSGLVPCALTEIRTHLIRKDKGALRIILSEFKGKSEEYFERIWNGVDSVEGVRFTSQALIDMLLELNGDNQLSLTN